MNGLLRHGIAVVFLLGASCAVNGPTTSWKTLSLPNACRVNAEGYKAAYTAQHSQKDYFWARVLVIKWNDTDRPNGHALCVVEWNRELWAYDQQWGSRFLTKNLDAKANPYELAYEWIDDDRNFEKAFFHGTTP